MVPGFHLSCMKPEHTPLDDEDWFCSEQDGYYKSSATATKAKGVGNWSSVHWQTAADDLKGYHV